MSEQKQNRRSRDGAQTQQVEPNQGIGGQKAPKAQLFAAIAARNLAGGRRLGRRAFQQAIGGGKRRHLNPAASASVLPTPRRGPSSQD